MTNYSKNDPILQAASKIWTGKQLNEAKYGKDEKVVRAMDIIQEFEPGEQWGEFLQAMAEFVSAGYGDLSKQRGEDNPLGSQTNLRSWKQMSRSFERLADLEWGDDPEEEPIEEPIEEPTEEPEGEESEGEENVEEDTSVGSVAMPDGIPLGKKKEQAPKLGTAARNILSASKGY